MARRKRGTAWIARMFSTGQAAEGNIVRRSVKSVMDYASMSDLEAAVKARGFHMLMIGAQVVVICNQHGLIKTIC